MLQEISFEERRIHIWDEPSALPLSLPFLQENAPYLPKAERPSAWYKELVLKNVLLQHEIAHLYFYQKQYGLSMTSVFLWRKRFHSWRTSVSYTHLVTSLVSVVEEPPPEFWFFCASSWRFFSSSALRFCSS